MARSTASTNVDPHEITRLRALLKAAPAKSYFDPDVGYLELMGDVKARTTASTFAMELPLVAAVYERWWRPSLVRIAKGVSGPSMEDEYTTAGELLQLEDGDVVLDLGCGPGNFTRRFARSAGGDGLVVGYDGSRPMLDRAIVENASFDGPPPAYVHGDATSLPFKAGSFDALCCFAALNLFPDPMATLDESARVLKSGGRIALLTSNVSGNQLAKLPAKVFGKVAGMSMFREEELRTALEERGFEVTAQQGHGSVQVVGAVRTGAAVI